MTDETGLKYVSRYTAAVFCLLFAAVVKYHGWLVGMLVMFLVCLLVGAREAYQEYKHKNR